MKQIKIKLKAFYLKYFVLLYGIHVEEDFYSKKEDSENLINSAKKKMMN